MLTKNYIYLYISVLYYISALLTSLLFLSSQMQFTVEISYFEIYNEKIHDLLAPSKKKDNKKVQVNFLTLLLRNSVEK